MCFCMVSCFCVASLHCHYNGQCVLKIWAKVRQSAETRYKSLQAERAGHLKLFCHLFSAPGFAPGFAADWIMSKRRNKRSNTQYLAIDCQLIGQLCDFKLDTHWVWCAQYLKQCRAFFEINLLSIPFSSCRFSSLPLSFRLLIFKNIFSEHGAVCENVNLIKWTDRMRINDLNEVTIDSRRFSLED